MDDSMDVLPFSLSCDRCEYRTKSMSAMRQHAESHQAALESQARRAVEAEARISGVDSHCTSGENAALQALVDSALRDASGLLLSPQDNHHDRTNEPTTTRNLVEEVGRTDSHRNRTEDRCINDPSRLLEERMQSHAASTLVAEDLLGIYAAGIDLSVVGGGAGDGHFGDGSIREEVMDVGVRNVNEDGRIMDGHRRDTNQPAAHSQESEPFGGTKQYYYVPFADAAPQKESNEPDTISNTGVQQSMLAVEESAATQKSTGRSTRPLFQFVIHPSAFAKATPPGGDVPPSSTKDTPILTKDMPTSAKGTPTMDSVLSPPSPSSSQGAAKPVKKLEVVTTALRTRGQRTKTAAQKNAKEAEEDTVPGRRRGRKLACPVKVILSPQQRKQRSSRGGRGGRSSSRLSGDEWKKTRHKCTECSFSCKFKKDLAAHTKTTHAKQRLGKVSFEIGNRRVSQARVSKDGEEQVRRTSRRPRISSRVKVREKDEMKPRKRGRPLRENKETVTNTIVGARDGRIIRRRGKGKERPNSPKLDRNQNVGLKVSPNVSDDDDDVNGLSLNEDEENTSDEVSENEDSVCNVCQKFVADSPADMKRHKTEMHSAVSRNSTKQSKCNFCDYSCQFRKTLAAHIHNSHSEQDQAKLQELKSLPKLERRKVSRSVDTNRVYRCNMCEFSCHASHLLNSHMKSKHNFEKMSGEFTCDECGKIIVGRYSHFRRHLRTHTDERPFKCDECPLAFRDVNSLNCHKPIHKDDRDYLCEECGMAFKRPINLRMHRKVHTDKSFACEDCDYRCRRRNTLINHKKRKHLKQKTVLCQHCGHRFFSKTECKNHVMKKHTPRPTPFACPVCPQVFMFQYRFRAHLKTHREIKPYKCSYCGFETRLNTYLMDHMRQHTGEKPKKCNLCDYTTSTNSNLYKHKKRHHGPAGGVAGRNPRLRKTRCKVIVMKDAGIVPGNSESKIAAEKNEVEEMVNAVDFGQLSSQVITSSTIFAVSPMSTQELKQEHLMQVPPVDVHHSLPLLTGEVNVIANPIMETNHEADRLSLSDKTSSSVAAMMEALAEARNMRQPTHQQTHQHTLAHHNPYPIHLLQPPQSSGAVVNTTATYQVAQAILPRASTNMTMHYSHPNIGAINGGNPGAMQATHYHHLSALAGEAAARSPITTHSQQTVHNTVIPPPLLGVGQVPTPPPPLGHFPNMMHF